MEKTLKSIILFLIFSPIYVYTQFVLNGSATNQGGGEFRLTPALGNRVGSIWYEDKISLNEPFELNFEMFFGNNDGGADGMTFCLQPLNTSIGVPGGGLGVQGVQPSLFVEFDTWPNSGDPFFDHLAIQRNGNVSHSFPNMLSAPTRIRNGVDNVEDGQWYPIRVTWNPTTRVFMVFVDCQMRSMYIGDIVNDIFNGDPMVFWGFTASTGGATNIHAVRNVRTNLISIPDQVICRNGSIQVDIPPTSSNFTWTPTTGINNLTSLTPVFSPTQTTEYVISYEGFCNTFVRDTFLVEVGIDSDNDGICDLEDLDDDNDGILDSEECKDGGASWDFETPIVGPGNNNQGTVFQGWTCTGGGWINLIRPPYGGNVPQTASSGNQYVEVGGTGIFERKYTVTETGRLTIEIDFACWGGVTEQTQIKLYKSDGTTLVSQSDIITTPPPVSWNDAWKHKGKVTTNLEPGDYFIKFHLGNHQAFDNVKISLESPSSCDYDKDGIINSLDLDSDGDGCPDAIEGGMLFGHTDLNNEKRLLGGVDINGVPILVNGGQSIGTSNNNLLLDDLCIICDAPDKGEIGSNQSICSGEIPSLLSNINDGQGIIFEWQFSDNNGISWTTINNEDKSTYEPTTELTNNRWYRRRSRKDCTPIIWSDWSNNVIITVNPIPSITGLNPVNGSVCGIGSVLLGISGVNSNNTIDWYDSDINGNILSTNSINFNSPDISENRNYFAQLKDLSTGCINKNRIKVDAIFHKLPVVNLGNDTSICDKQNINIGVNNIFNNYFWNNGKTSNSIVVSESGEYILSVVDGNLCQSTDTILITVNPLPVFSLGNDTSICIDKNITLGIEPIFNKYLWDNGNTSNKITSNQQGNYKLIVTDNNGCVNSDSINLSINPLPVFSLGNDTSICIDKNITLGIEPIFSKYLWNTGSSSNKITTNQQGNYKLTVTDNNGCVNSDEINLSINPLPVFNLGNDTSICVDKNITLGVNDLYIKYLWNTGSSSNKITTNQQGNYKLTVTDVNGCVNSDSINLSINPLPVFNLGNDTSICVDKNITLGVNDLYIKYLWNTGSTSNKITTSNSGKYTLIVTDVNGCMNSDEINLSINPLPVFSLGNDTSICIDKNITLGIEPIFSKYLWSTGSTSNKITTNQQGNYKLTVTDVNGCVNSDSINLSINPLPVFNLGNDTSICIDKNITLGIEPIFSKYLWNTGSASNKITTNQQGNYKLTVTDVNGCVNSDEINLSINPLPIFNLGNDTSICVDKNITLGVNDLYIKYLWNNGNTSNKITINQQGNYKLTVTDVNGCISSESISISINPLPVFNLGNDTSICVDKNITLGIEPIFNKYLWSTESVSNKITINQQGNYKLIVTDINGCVNSDEINLSINPLPVFSLGNDTSICTYQNITFGVEPIYSKYLWNNGSIFNKISTSNSGKYTLTVTDNNGCISSDDIVLVLDELDFNIKEEYNICESEEVELKVDIIKNIDKIVWNNTNIGNTYTTNKEGVHFVKGFSKKGCELEKNSLVNITELPILDFDRNVEVCDNSKVDIDIDTKQYEIIWYDGLRSNKRTIRREGIFKFDLINKNDKISCLLNDSVNVKFNFSPEIVDMSDQYFCFDEKDTLLLSIPSKANFYYLGDDLRNIYDKNIIPIFSEGIYTISFFNSDGCESKQEVVVVNECEGKIFIPNSFTPNNNGLNDVFKIYAENIDEYEMYIYNRWGQMIFKTNDINQGWDGRFNGDLVKTDVYVYLIRLKYNKLGKNISKEYTGHITIYK